jgi:hypothetical protein
LWVIESEALAVFVERRLVHRLEPEPRPGLDSEVELLELVDGGRPRLFDKSRNSAPGDDIDGRLEK